MLVGTIIAVIVVIAYFLGSIPFGLIVGRAHGVDIRQHGSGNIGATNVWRTLGKKAGLTTFACDMGKGLVAVIIAKTLAAWFLHGGADAHDHWGAWAGIAAAFGCILGHSFPIWLGFRGGKGVATSLGVIIGMMPMAALIAFAIWVIVFAATRYVSLASIMAALLFPAIVFGLMFFKWIEGWAYFYFAVAACALVVRRHFDNIKRLLAGTESRFGQKKSTESNPPPQ